jgi:presenilin-like A22 family membrane protease
MCTFLSHYVSIKSQRVQQLDNEPAKLTNCSIRQSQKYVLYILVLNFFYIIVLIYNKKWMPNLAHEIVQENKQYKYYLFHEQIPLLVPHTQL